MRAVKHDIVAEATADQVSQPPQEEMVATKKSSMPRRIIGLLLCVAAGIVFYRNEAAILHNQQVYRDGLGAIVEAGVTPQPQNESKLVHVTAQPAAKLRDNQLGASTNSPRMRRKVLMYQWVEKQEAPATPAVTSAATTPVKTTFAQEWSEKYWDISDFKAPDEAHINPKPLFASQNYTADRIMLGGYTLEPMEQGVLLGTQGDSYKPLVLTEKDLVPFPEAWKKVVRIDNGGFYIGHGTPDAPHLGDFRISYEVLTTSPVSMLAQQRGNSLVPYKSQYNGTIFAIKPGQAAASSMASFPPNQGEERMKIIRAASLVVLAFGAIIGFSFPGLALVGIGVPAAGAFLWYKDEPRALALLAISVLFMLVLLFHLQKRKRHTVSEVVAAAEPVATAPVPPPAENSPSKEAA